MSDRSLPTASVASRSRRIMAITDRRLMGKDPIATAAALVERLGRQLILHIREKDLSPLALLAWTDELGPLCRRSGADLVVNGRLDIAMTSGVGIHLPESGLALRSVVRVRSLGGLGGLGGRISVACHGLERAKEAMRLGADAVTISPVFSVPGKTEPMGVEGLRALVERLAPAPSLAPTSTSSPSSVSDSDSDSDSVSNSPGPRVLEIFALGGIDESRAEEVWATGVHGIAAIRSIWLGDPERLLLAKG